MEAIVREATAADARILHEVAAATFPLACPPGVSEENIRAFIDENLSEERFAAYLADPDRMLFLAAIDGVAAGYTMLIGGEPSDPDVASAVRARPTVELSKCYALPEFHGQGVAAVLMERSAEAARAAGAKSLWLGVNQLNARANRFYEKQGFQQVGTKRFRLGRHWESDYVRELPLAGPST